MCKSGIINNQDVEMVAANHQGHGGTPHSHHWQTEFLHGFNLQNYSSTHTPVCFSLVCSETQDMVHIQKLFIQEKKNCSWWFLL